VYIIVCSVDKFYPPQRLQFCFKSRDPCRYKQTAYVR